MKIIAENRNARFEYFIEETFEAGIELIGCEVKSVRAGNVNLRDAFVFIRNGQMTLKNMHVAPYDKGSFSNVEPRRDRKLLMHAREIARLFGKVQEKGYAVIPTKLYLKGSLVKIEVALAKGKQRFDKRQSIKEREEKRNVQRLLKEYNR